MVKNFKLESIQKRIIELIEKTKKKSIINPEDKKKETSELTNFIAESGILESKTVFLNVFMEVLKAGVNKFEAYYNETIKNMNESKRRIKENYHRKMIGRTPEEVIEIEKEKNNQLSLIVQKEKYTINMIIKEYKEYMKKTIINTKSLPMNVKIVIPSNDIIIPQVILNPMDSIIKIKEIIIDKLAEQKLPIKIGKSLSCSVLNESDGKVVEILDLNKDDLIISKTQISQGSALEISGNLKICKEVCIMKNFDPNKKQLINYFTCNTCKLDWICEMCMKKCHKKHICKLFLENHVTDWACCYCSKANCLLPK